MPPLYSPPWLPQPPQRFLFALAFKAQHNVELIPLMIKTPAIPLYTRQPTSSLPLPYTSPKILPLPSDQETPSFECHFF